MGRCKYNTRHTNRDALGIHQSIRPARQPCWIGTIGSRFPRAALQAAGPVNCDSPISSINDTVFPRDVNTSTSWDVIDPYCDEEVIGITSRHSQPQVNRPANTNTDSDPSNLDLGLKQVSDTDSNQNLGTLYNQDFFVVDTTGRRLSQIPCESNYPYPLPNGHSALQLRLPDLLIYLKTDTYLMDVNTGEHYAIYSDRIQKMSVTPKLYSAWGYKQLCTPSTVMPYDLV